MHTYVLLAGILFSAFGQDSARAHINQIFSAVNKFSATRASERLYLHTDKNYYATDDTLRFKAYLLQASNLNASAKSGVMYIEIANDSNRVMTRTVHPVYNGLAAGQIALDSKSFPQGVYILRAYTNWMRNFGEASVFRKQFLVSHMSSKDWLINYKAQATANADKSKIQLNLQVNQFDQSPAGLRKLQLRLTDGKRTLLKNEMETDLGGQLAVNFDLPVKANSKRLSLMIQDLRKGENDRKIYIPFILNRPAYIDLQFMPEGGHLVAGLPALIAFKALNEDGSGTDVSGEIFDSQQHKITAFNSIHKGIGSFYLLPQANETYHAKIKLPDGSYKTYPLPGVQASGITMKADNHFKSDSIEITLNATPDIAAVSSTYYLIGHTRGVVYYGAAIRMYSIHKKVFVSKKHFPSGVAHFTLTSTDKKALNERIVFIDHNDNLRINISANKPVYKQRDSVAVNIQVTDAGGAPVQGSFSLAVTDNTQVNTDSISHASLINHMLLTSDLSGTVEDPGYYYNFTADSIKWHKLDNLLLAQGWVNYNWNDAFLPAKPLAYIAEPEFTISGRVTNMFNKPVANSGVTLFSKKPVTLTDAVTNSEGVFTFKGITPADTTVYFLQAKNKKGKSFNVGIEMDEFKSPTFTPPTERLIPWYVNIDNNSIPAIKKQVVLQENFEKLTGANLLRDVVIKSKRIIKDSKNLNGAGEADLIIDEEELNRAGRTTLGDLLRNRVKGFGVKPTKEGELYYHIFGTLLHLVIDGINTDFFLPEGASRFEFLNEYFEYYDAEEIKGIEVMSNPSRTSRYTSEFLGPFATSWKHSFIEVTTRSGHGPFVKKAVGTYVFRPTPFTLYKPLYAPRYKPDSMPDMTDIRSTIHWDANIVTDKDGKASINFYTSDNAGTYTYILEGADMAGSLGAAIGTISVKATRTP
ncbi:carboxypeptidase-like regulatory domain-containing protein [Mucilaginibacter lacusdianchii]|uniref:carboxypeptidase-like regulatory domain-containing protein n=1 Tax=Mucilaginibacter lacusdianchii TaxID=2684211 RepID=UPI00131E8BE7|nr:carboxypeptidase-like regulatory domain-containing protein [Mucilaginibacter sp. JXJ CY 39]